MSSTNSEGWNETSSGKREQGFGGAVLERGDDLVITYRETTATGHGIAWLGEWSVETGFWVQAEVRYQTISTHPGYRMREARVTRNREQQIFFRLTARR